MTPQEKTELKFVLKTAKEIFIALAVVLTLTYLIVKIWKL